MIYSQITKMDEGLIAAAMQVIRSKYLPGKHRVGAAVRGKSGKIYTGIHLNSSALDVCAEWIAMGTAMTNGEIELDSIVAVMKLCDECEFQVISPCGVCRELIRFYGDDIQVIFSEGGDIKKCSAKHLLPGAYIPPTPGRT